jgi:hypothetical protein
MNDGIVSLTLRQMRPDFTDGAGSLGYGLSVR